MRHAAACNRASPVAPAHHTERLVEGLSAVFAAKPTASGLIALLVRFAHRDVVDP